MTIKKLFDLKVRQSRKQIMVSSILPKNERWDNFQYIKLSQRSFFGRIEDTINCFRDLLTFTSSSSDSRQKSDVKLRSLVDWKVFSLVILCDITFSCGRI